jgi:D-alanyl-D-alanine carboxypeptidase
VLGTLPAKSHDEPETGDTDSTPVPLPRASATKNVQPRSGWMIQVGAFTAEDEAKDRLSSVRTKATDLLSSADPFTEVFVKGDTTYYRARFAGLKKDQAVAACKYLKRKDVACMPLKN